MFTLVHILGANALHHVFETKLLLLLLLIQQRRTVPFLSALYAFFLRFKSLQNVDIMHLYQRNLVYLAYKH